MTFLSRVFRHRDESGKKTTQAQQDLSGQRFAPVRPRYVSTWDSTHVEPDEVEELLHSCTVEIKSRAEALDTPFLLLPFRPEYDSNSSKTFIRNFYAANREGRSEYRGAALQQELRLSTAEVLCSIVKWCWARLPGGVVSWNIYELFRLGESESGMLRTAFDTFIPLSAPSESTKNIICDFFDLLAAIAAHGKVNGLTGSKLSRLAGWWAFALPDDSVGFETAYRHWASAADATSHLFFAYLRSRAPEDIDGTKGISSLPRSLQSLAAQTEYPPQLPAMMQTPTHKVVMIVDNVSPDPFALLRRANHFEFRAQDKALQQFADCIDPIQALTEECRRVLQAIAAANQSSSARRSPNNASSLALSSSDLAMVGNDGWSRFQDMGFATLSDASVQTSERTTIPLARSESGPHIFGPQPPSDDKARPTTPSWADFLAERSRPTFLPASKSLPALHGGPGRLQSQDSLQDELEPGELASTTQFKLDDAFWWVWMTSLAGEEPSKRKAAFGRCALIETHIPDGRWLVMEEQLKGATTGPEEGAYIAEKKSRFGFGRRKTSTRKKELERPQPVESATASVNQAKSAPGSPGVNVPFDQQLMIKAAAVELARKTRGDKPEFVGRRGRLDDASSVKTNSMLTINGMKDLQPALKWANLKDKEALREHYLGSGFSIPDAISEKDSNTEHAGAHTDPRDRDLPALPPSHMSKGNTPPHLESQLQAAAHVPLPAATPQEGHSYAASIQEVAQDESHPASPVDSANKASPESKFARLAPNTASSDSPDRRSVHPALREDADLTAGEAAAQTGALAAWQAAPESPSKRGDRVKLTKPRAGGTGGLRKMFSRNKRPSTGRASGNAIAKNSARVTAVPQASQSSQRASFEDTTPTNPIEPQTPPIGSTVHKALLPPNVQISSPTETHEDATPASPVDTLDQREANEHFAQFDQGMPASPIRAQVEHSPDHRQPLATHPTQEQLPESDYVSRPKQLNREESVYMTPMDVEELDQAQPFSAITEEDESPVQPEQDISQSERWAAIRRNVAVRTNTQDNANVESLPDDPESREPKRSSSLSASEQPKEAAGKTPTPRTPASDGGETSGEESIEDRVARIKARVAHLTANQPSRTNRAPATTKSTVSSANANA